MVVPRFTTRDLSILDDCGDSWSVWNRGIREQTLSFREVSKGAKIRNQYNQVPHLTQDTNGKVKLTVIHHKQEPRGQPFLKVKEGIANASDNPNG